MAIPGQGEYDSLEEFMGIKQDEAALQTLGTVRTTQGRLLVFPNTVQHRVGAFQLADASKPGHRKILAMFLVDPNRPILSSANVPPQRRDWWAEELLKHRALPLPNEVFEETISHVDFPLGWQAALEARLALMEERGGIRDRQTADLEQVKCTVELLEE
jgi:hypothetical protein